MDENEVQKKMKQMGALLRVAKIKNDSVFDQIAAAKKTDDGVFGKDGIEFLAWMENVQREEHGRLESLSLRYSMLIPDNIKSVDDGEFQNLFNDISKASAVAIHFNRTFQDRLDNGFDKICLPRLSESGALKDYIKAIREYMSLWSRATNWGREEGKKSLLEIIQMMEVEVQDQERKKGVEILKNLAVEIGKDVSSMLIGFHLLLSVAINKSETIGSWFWRLNQILKELRLFEGKTSHVFHQNFISTLTSLDTRVRLRKFSENVIQEIDGDKMLAITYDLLVELLLVEITFHLPTFPPILTMNEVYAIRDNAKQKLQVTVKQLRRKIRSLKRRTFGVGGYATKDAKQFESLIYEEGLIKVWKSLNI